MKNKVIEGAAALFACKGSARTKRMVQSRTREKSPILTKTRHALVQRLKQEGLVELNDHELPRSRFIPRCRWCGLVSGCSVFCEIEG